MLDSFTCMIAKPHGQTGINLKFGSELIGCSSKFGSLIKILQTKKCNSQTACSRGRWRSRVVETETAYCSVSSSLGSVCRGNVLKPNRGNGVSLSIDVDQAPVLQPGRTKQNTTIAARVNRADRNTLLDVPVNDEL